MVSSTNIAVSEYIVSDIPSFAKARENYYCDNLKAEYSEKNVTDLKMELDLMAGEENLNDEDRKEIERLMEEIDAWREDKVVELNSLPNEPLPELKPSQPVTLSLTLTTNLTQLHKQTL